MALAASPGQGATSSSCDRWNVSAFRPPRLQVAGEKPGKGNPADPGQARVQVSTHEQGGGASVGPTGARSSPYALKDTTQSSSFLECGRDARKAEGRGATRTIVSRCVQHIWRQRTPQ